jgi:putative oxidoreductase
MDTGLLLGRVVLGLLMAAHGSQKLLGWFGGYGIAGTGGFMESLGFRPGKFFAAAAGATEFAGGVLIALGLFGPLGPAMVISTMVVAIATVHWAHGPFAQNNGYELPLLYAVGAASLALIGYGAYSIDALLQLTWSETVIWAVLAVGVLGGLGNLLVRKTGPVAAHVYGVLAFFLHHPPGRRAFPGAGASLGRATLSIRLERHAALSIGSAGSG